MATRSTIAILNSDGSIDAIYCHWNGYPSNNGALLLEHYNNEDKIRELISLGGLSSLRERANPTTGVQHSFENPESGVTVAYHRDRGEKLQINRYSCESEWKMQRNREQWNYIWKDGAWYVTNSKSTKLIKLTKEFVEE